MAERPNPQIGDVVHYVSYGTPGGEYSSVCRAAIVTEDHEHPERRLGLAVLNPTGLFFNSANYAHQSQRAGGTWHYQCGEV